MGGDRLPLFQDVPRRLVLVRHGESLGNLADRAARDAGAERLDLDVRDADVDLSDNGQRQAEALFPTVREYTNRFGLTDARYARLGPDVLVMHPGPMNRGVEIASSAADGPRSVITEQVANGVAVRMAVLFQLLGTGQAARRSAASELVMGAADA